MYFLGTYTPKLDDKGRLILPAKFRDRLAKGLVVTQGQENCLDVWPEDVFNTTAAIAQSRGMTARRDRAYSRTLFATAEEGKPDKQGRITLTPLLRAYAGLTKDVVVTGAGDRVEIWNPATWQEYSSAAAIEFAELDMNPPDTG